MSHDVRQKINKKQCHSRCRVENKAVSAFFCVGKAQCTSRIRQKGKTLKKERKRSKKRRAGENLTKLRLFSQHRAATSFSSHASTFFAWETVSPGRTVFRLTCGAHFRRRQIFFCTKWVRSSFFAFLRGGSTHRTKSVSLLAKRKKSRYKEKRHANVNLLLKRAFGVFGESVEKQC